MARLSATIAAAALLTLATLSAAKTSSTSHSSTSTSTRTTTHTSSSSHTTTKTSPYGTSTFSIVTAASATPVASGVTIDNGKAYINYTTVDGYFLQDVNTTVASTFDYTAVNFGLINQTYAQDKASTASLTQWQRFNKVLSSLNSKAAKNVEYKLLFIGRHGEGWHNAAQTYYGTPAWNCYYSEQDGNSTASWQDAHLDAAGVAQAVTANLFWAKELKTQKIEPPHSYYVSPLTRCLQTANYTYGNLSLPKQYPFVPTVKELFREGISGHTCDHRSSRSYIAESFPSYKIEADLTETDELWNGITAETSSAQDYRSTVVLDDVFSHDSASIISITTHSGEAASLLRVLGHIPFSLVTGAIIPVLVKAETIYSAPPATTTSAWTTNAWCTNGPPLSSQTTGADACVCSDGVLPTTEKPMITGS